MKPALPGQGLGFLQDGTLGWFYAHDLDVDEFFEEDYQDDEEDELSVEQMSRDAGIY